MCVCKAGSERCLHSGEFDLKIITISISSNSLAPSLYYSVAPVTSLYVCPLWVKHREWYFLCFKLNPFPSAFEDVMIFGRGGLFEKHTQCLVSSCVENFLHCLTGWIDDFHQWQGNYSLQDSWLAPCWMEPLSSTIKSHKCFDITINQSSMADFFRLLKETKIRL